MDKFWKLSLLLQWRSIWKIVNLQLEFPNKIKGNKKEVSTRFCMNPACPLWWVSNTCMIINLWKTQNLIWVLITQVCANYIGTYIKYWFKIFSSFFSHYLFVILKPISPHFCNPEERLLAKKKVETKNSASLLFFQIFFGPCECISTWLP